MKTLPPLLASLALLASAAFSTAISFAAEPARSPASTGVAAPAASANSAARPLYLDPSQPQEARIKDLVSRMTLEEKAGLMRNTTPGVPRLGIPKYDWWNEALHGVARAGEATVFPQAIGLAATWNEPLLRQVSGTIGVEARAKFNAVAGTEIEGLRYYGLTFWAPNINIFRDPRWGRGQETYGEDPFLTARMGVAFVRGLQGDNSRYLQAAGGAKHYAVHSGPESLRHEFDVSPSEADLYETYLPAFEALVREGQVEIVMNAYNSLYGKPCSISPLLFSLLKKWGFNGHVTSDSDSIEDLIKTYKLAADDAEAQALAANAGIDTRAGEPAPPPALVEAVKRGLITEAVIDQRVSALLRTMFRLGIFDPKEVVPFNAIPASANNAPAHHALALKATQESLVLLKNNGVLPLDVKKLKRVAVIGPNANSESVLVGNYFGTPVSPVTVLAGLRARLGSDVQVDYVRGCDYAEPPPGTRLISRTALRIGEMTGLLGHYFANPRLEGNDIARHRSRPLNLDFAKDRPLEGVPAENVSVRWTGDLIPPLGGEYQLVVRARGGVRFKVADEIVMDDWTPGEKTLRAKKVLPGNVRVPVTLEYFADGPLKISLEWEVPPANSGFAAAVAAARAADAVVFVGGLTAELEGEEMELDYVGFRGGDRTRIELPPVQERLLAELHATGKPLAVVLMSGSAVALPWTAEHANAILQAWYPGQAGGTAVADVLFGATNPAGRLPVTFYRATEDLPPFEDYQMANRTYRYFRGTPLYPFGHGLSYTSFRYANLSASAAEEAAGRRVRVSVEVTNTGSRDGDEVVQLYANEPESWHARTVRSLCGFARVSLRAGETKTVSIDVPATALRRWDPAIKDYTVPRGAWRISVGASSADLRADTTVQIR